MRGIKQIRRNKNLYVEECLQSDVERNQTLDWVEQQNPIIKYLSELKFALEYTIKGVKLTAYQNSIKEQQEREDEITMMQERRAIESKKNMTVSWRRS